MHAFKPQGLFSFSSVRLVMGQPTIKKVIGVLNSASSQVRIYLSLDSWNPQGERRSSNRKAGRISCVQRCFFLGGGRIQSQAILCNTQPGPKSLQALEKLNKARLQRIEIASTWSSLNLRERVILFLHGEKRGRGRKEDNYSTFFFPCYLQGKKLLEIWHSLNEDLEEEPISVRCGN